MKHIILGSGPIGLSLMDASIAKGHEVIIINRDGIVYEPIPESVTLIACDLLDSAKLQSLITGADFVFHAASPVNQTRLSELVPLMQSIISAMSGTKIPLIYIDTMDAYGDAHGLPISEQSPELAGYPLAIERKKASRLLLDSHFSKKIIGVVARSPYAFGPRIKEGVYGKSIFAELLLKKQATIIGKLDYPHSYGYSRDIGRNLVLLTEYPEHFGRVWNLPCAQALTMQQFLDILRDMLSRRVEFNQITESSGLGKLFNPIPKHLKDTLFMFDRPYVSNFSRFSTTFGERCTAHTQALWETLEWYRKSGLGY